MTETLRIVEFDGSLFTETDTIGALRYHFLSCICCTKINIGVYKGVKIPSLSSLNKLYCDGIFNISLRPLEDIKTPPYVEGFEEFTLIRNNDIYTLPFTYEQILWLIITNCNSFKLSQKCEAVFDVVYLSNKVHRRYTWNTVIRQYHGKYSYIYKNKTFKKEKLIESIKQDIDRVKQYRVELQNTSILSVVDKTCAENMPADIFLARETLDRNTLDNLLKKIDDLEERLEAMEYRPPGGGIHYQTAKEQWDIHSNQ